MEKISNFTEANKFYAKEMEEYMKDKDISKQDKFILWVQKISSNFGQDWLLPAFWIIILSITFSFLDT